MSVIYHKGQQLGKEDLFITLVNSSEYPVNAAEISYALYYVEKGTKAEALLGAPRRTPVNAAVGHYFASLIIPLDAQLGDYRIRWEFRETIGGPINSVVQEFGIVDKATSSLSVMPDIESDLVRRLRISLRDNNPDRNYRLRPAAHEETVRQYNRVFGHVWLDDELQEYLFKSLDRIATTAPATPFSSITQMVQQFPNWKTLLIDGAMMDALFAAMENWIVEEVSYSIGGVSLDLDKSSRYESAFQAKSDQFDKQLERAKATVKYTKGLQQPRYGIGIRSAFGPYTGQGILSPAKFVGF